MLKNEVSAIVEQYQTQNIDEELFLERLMITGSQPRQINKYLPKQYRNVFTAHYSECIWLANTLGKGLFY